MDGLSEQHRGVRTWQESGEGVHPAATDETCGHHTGTRQEYLLSLFEDMCVKHVVGMQIKDKTLGKLIRGNHAVELADPVQTTSYTVPNRLY